MPPPTRHLLCVYPWMEIGGADKFNLDLLGCLRARGWTATVVTTLPSRHPWRAEFEKVADELVDLGALPPEERPSRLVACAERRPPTVALLSHSSAGYRLLPYLRSRLPDLPWADYCHMEELHWEDGGFPRMSLRQATRLDRQVVSSRHLKDWLTERGADPARIDVCPTNIDLARWDPGAHDRAALRQALDIPENAPVILYAGRLVAQKQPPLALSVLREVAAARPDAVGLVAGSGTYAGYARGYLRHHGLESRIRLLGAVSNPRMHELLAASDLFFLPSEMEGISLALFEAMAMGVVPVGADVGGQSELVTPDCGILVRRGPGEAGRYRDALLGLMQDREALTRRGQAGRARLQAHFRLDQMGESMEAALLRAVAQHRAEPRPAVSPAEAEASLQAAIEAARRDEQETPEQIAARPSWKRRIRAAYWNRVDRGAWWLVPALQWLGPTFRR